MAMVIVGFVSLILELGLETALIRSQDPSADLYNNAWSMRVIQRSALALIVIGFSPIAAHIYNDVRVTPILVAVGMSQLICAFENIYTANLRKYLDFRADFLYTIIPKITSFAAAVTSVVVLQSYWGLVIGICVSEVMRALLSYFIVKDRPRWSLSRWRELAGFSGWFMAKGLGDFIVAESDKLILGVLGGARLTGIFSVAKEVATLPSSEIVLPICRALTPTLSTISGDTARLSAAIGKSLSGTMLLVAPISLGFALISTEFVTLLFGPKWTESIPLLSILCVAGIAFAFREIAANALIVTGKIHITVALSWLNSSVILLLFYPAYTNYGLTGVAWLTVFATFVTAAVYAVALVKLNITSNVATVFEIIRVIASAIIMYLLVNHLSHFVGELNLVLSLVLKIASGAFVYVVSVIALWLLAGKPFSIEKLFFLAASRKVKTIFRHKTH